MQSNIQKRTATRLTLPAVAAICVLALSACSDMSRTQQRTLSGAAIGAGVGAAGTAMTGGCISCGAAIGAGVGAGTGYVFDRMNR
jgi:osmotically inducible lipoprotein OsmB